MDGKGQSINSDLWGNVRLGLGIVVFIGLTGIGYGTWQKTSNNNLTEQLRRERIKNERLLSEKLAAEKSLREAKEKISALEKEGAQLDGNQK